MKIFTVIYTDSFMSGSHRHVLVMKKCIKVRKSETFSKACERQEIDPSFITFVFEGDHECVDWSNV